MRKCFTEIEPQNINTKSQVDNAGYYLHKSSMK